MNFAETDYDLSKFSTKSVTYPKMQEVKSSILINCFKKFFLKNHLDKKKIIKNLEKEICKNRNLKSISEELYKRLIIPFYTLIISLVGASLIIEPKSRYFTKFHKLNIFLIGTLVIILSQISIKFIFNTVNTVNLVIILPITLVLIYYLYLFLITKFKLNFL